MITAVPHKKSWMSPSIRLFCSDLRTASDSLGNNKLQWDRWRIQTQNSAQLAAPASVDAKSLRDCLVAHIFSTFTGVLWGLGRETTCLVRGGLGKPVLDAAAETFGPPTPCQPVPVFHAPCRREKKPKPGVDDVQDHGAPREGGEERCRRGKGRIRYWGEGVNRVH